MGLTCSDGKSWRYMGVDPVKRGLVADAKLWVWSSYRFCHYGESLFTADGLKD
jgi:hypothetical protein